MGLIVPGGIAGGGLIHVPASASPPSFTGILDSVIGAGAAYSLRRLNKTYTGALIRVRRNSDNAEADIGYDASGNLDESVLLAHVGTGNGFVVTWYDQSGHSRNVTQATTGSQPQIVSTGALITLGGKPSIDFSSSKYLTNASPFMYSSGSASVIAVGSTTNGTSRVVVAEGRTTQSAPIYEPLKSDTSTGASLGAAIRNNTRTSVLSGVAGSLPVFSASLSQSVLSSVDAGNGLSLYVNGVSAYSGSYTRSGSLTLDSFTVGARVSTGVSGFWNGRIAEVIIYPSALNATNRQSIERNQGGYYGVTVA